MHQQNIRAHFLICNEKNCKRKNFVKSLETVRKRGKGKKINNNHEKEKQ